MNIFLDFAKRYVRRYLWWYVAGVLCIIATQGLMVAIVEWIKDAIDQVTQPGASANTVVPFALNIIMVAPLIVLVRIASRLLIFTPGRLSEFHIRNDFYSRLLSLQRDFFNTHQTGDLVSRCSNDIGFIRGAFGFGFLQVANVTVTFILVMVAMLNMDPRATLYIAVPMIVSFAIIQTSIHLMFNHWRTANVQLGDLSSLTLASYKGVSAIQNYHAEPAVEGRFRTANDQYLETLKHITRTRSFAIPLVQLVGYVSIFTVLWFVGRDVIAGEMTMGEVAAFVGYINMIMPPLLSLGWMLNVFNRAIPAIERMNEVLKAEVPDESQQPGAEVVIKKPVTMRARDLGFEFAKGKESSFHLRQVNFTLEPGKVLGIAGPVGSGKTALLETLIRLNALQPNQLFLNRQDAAALPLNHFREWLSFTPQRPLLFSTTLRDNLRVALPETIHDQDEEEATLMAALECAAFDLDPKQFPLGLETQVGEKGVMLSGGQRQRIALARALLKRAEIYIFDDVLSAVDHDTEKKIIRNIRAFAPGKSFIIASHRVSAIQRADEILVLDQGTVVARGNHEALMAGKNFYRDIFLYQSEMDGEA